jgi:hypothetical protein
MEDVAHLFVQRAQVGAEVPEGLGASDGTETPGDLLVGFRHADIVFGLVVVEGHTRGGEKTQDIVGVLAQTQEKIDRGELFDTATLPVLGAGAGRIVPFALAEDCFVLVAQTGEPRSCQRASGQLRGIGLVLARHRKSIILRGQACSVASSK